MKNHQIAFLTIADSNYFKTLLVSAKQTQSLYPFSKFYIYDWGLSPDQLKILRELPNVVLKSWNLKYPNPFTSKFGKWNIKQELLHLLKLIKNFLLKNKSDGPLYLMGFESRMYNKLLCINDANKTIRGPFVFTDGDAFLINRIDELLQDDIDIGVTLRRKNERNISFNHCNMLNAGVLFFLGRHEQNTAFIKSWINELTNTQELIAEQTALTRFLHRQKKEIFDSAPSIHTFNIRNVSMRIAILPCEVYNYNWIEEFDVENDKDRVKILHFKSGRLHTSLFDKIINELKI